MSANMKIRFDLRCSVLAIVAATLFAGGKSESPADAFAAAEKWLVAAETGDIRGAFPPPAPPAAHPYRPVQPPPPRGKILKGA